jgi:hypothetical protein
VAHSPAAGILGARFIYAVNGGLANIVLDENLTAMTMANTTNETVSNVMVGGMNASNESLTDLILPETTLLVLRTLARDVLLRLNTLVGNDGVRRTPRIIVVGHGQGTALAHMLFTLLRVGITDSPVDVLPTNTNKQTVFVSLDGVLNGLSYLNVGWLYRTIFFYGFDSATATFSTNTEIMRLAQRRFGWANPRLGAIMAVGSGCPKDADQCVHEALINTKPHWPGLDISDDYSNFTLPRMVQTRWALQVPSLNIDI